MLEQIHLKGTRNWSELTIVATMIEQRLLGTNNSYHARTDTLRGHQELTIAATMLEQIHSEATRNWIELTIKPTEHSEATRNWIV